MEFLADLERAVEAVETRVPYGKPAMRLFLSGALLYALLFVLTRLAVDFFWPVTQFAISLMSQLRGSNVPVSIPERAVILKALAWFLAGITTAFATGFATVMMRRFLLTLSDRLKEIEAAIDRYQSIFWKPLGESERKQLIATLTGLGKHSVSVTAHENTDCAELAHDLRDCFEQAGWNVARIPLTGTWGSAGASGFRLWQKARTRDFNTAMFNALLAAVKGPIQGRLIEDKDGPEVSLYGSDVAILVGTKRISND